MRLRVQRLLVGLGAATALTLGTPAVAHADVAAPPLPVVPPAPPQLAPVLNVLAPVGSPTCGSAALLALTASSLVPASVGVSSLLGTGLAPVYIACGNVPVPDSSTALVCAQDDQIFGVLSTLTLAAIGAQPPISTRTVGPVVETVYVVQAGSPAALGSLGAAAILGGALACRPLHPAAPPPAASSTTGGDESASPASGDDYLSPYLGSDFALGAGGTTLPGLALPPGTRLTPAATDAPAHPFAYPFVFVLPLLLLALGGYLARSLTDDIRFPSA